MVLMQPDAPDVQLGELPTAYGTSSCRRFGSTVGPPLRATTAPSPPGTATGCGSPHVAPASVLRTKWIPPGSASYVMTTLPSGIDTMKGRSFRSVRLTAT